MPVFNTLCKKKRGSALFWIVCFVGLHRNEISNADKWNCVESSSDLMKTKYSKIRGNYVAACHGDLRRSPWIKVQVIIKNALLSVKCSQNVANTWFQAQFHLQSEANIFPSFQAPNMETQKFRLIIVFYSSLRQLSIKFQDATIKQNGNEENL